MAGDNEENGSPAKNESLEKKEEVKNGDTGSDYILVRDAAGELMELPTTDNALFVTTLQSSFPGATGIKYKNPKTGASRAIQMDPTGLKLLPPADGWDDKEFTVIFPPQSERVRVASSGEAAVGSAKRRKVGSSNRAGDDDDSDDEADGRYGRKRATGEKSTESGGDGDDDEKRPVDLIVLGVDYKTTDETFRKYFDELGTVVFCEVKRHGDGGSKGFGFVRMATLEEQDDVLNVPNHQIDNRRCEVKVPDQRDQRGQRQTVTRIFVGRLTDKITVTMLTDYFNTEAGKINEKATVTDVFIPKPFRGFAFVTFSTGDIAAQLVKQGVCLIQGCSAVLSLAVPRDDPPQAAPRSFNDHGYPYGYGRAGPGGPHHGDFPDRGYQRAAPQHDPYYARHQPYARAPGGGRHPEQNSGWLSRPAPNWYR